MLFSIALPIGANAAASEKLDPQLNYMANCRIYDSNFNLVKIVSSDWLCLPLADGGWISSDNKQHISRRDAEGQLIWSKKGFYHHQLSQINNAFVLTLLSEKKVVKKQNIVFDRIQKISISDGSLVNEFSIFDGLYKSKILARTPLDKKPAINTPNLLFFDTDLENSHFNSIMYKDRRIYVNELQLVSFVLDENLKFIEFIEFPDLLFKTEFKDSHDLQSLGNDTFLLFKNFNLDPITKSKTFKIFEFKKNKVIFEFPINSTDFVRADFSGGVEKNKDGYLVGFPLASGENSDSLVGLISNDGHWIVKKTIPFRIQDIKRIPYENYLKLNKIN